MSTVIERVKAYLIERHRKNVVRATREARHSGAETTRRQL